MVRTAFAAAVLFVCTILFGSLVLLAQLVGVRPRRGGIYEKAPDWWARALLWASGVKVVVHDGTQLPAGAPRVYIANHVSWYDIPAMIAALPHYGFVAKRELERIPLFGAAARAVGVIFIDRDNRKAAFAAYESAAGRIREGHPVLVYPEGTRGEQYALRPFKKGPFVLAIGAQAPIVPTVIHGTIEVNPRGSFRANPGTVHVHLLDPLPTAGLSYDEREALADRVRLAMADCLRDVYGVVPALLGQDVPATERSLATQPS